MATTMPTGSEERKAVPLCTGVLDYFGAALAEVARVSKAGNDKHNPGQPLHWAREKSADHADCILRHLADRGAIDPGTGMRHSAELAWRALALLQTELEAEGVSPSRGSVFPQAAVTAKDVLRTGSENELCIRCKKPLVGARFSTLAGPMHQQCWHDAYGASNTTPSGC